MHDLNELLDLTKEVALKVGTNILEHNDQEYKSYVFSSTYPKEVKALADTIIEKDILKQLTLTGLPILSEESGYLPNKHESGYYFILDPLDGTFNFVKGLGPCAVSIALWDNNKPVFGVIYDLLTKHLIYGGSMFGAYCDGKKIKVSSIENKEEASICTGFPVRFDVKSDETMKGFWNMVRPYAKVRMLGSAAMSLVNVGKGAAEVYSEKNIMLWDVAAGIAIVDGAGGVYKMNEATDKWSYDITASNGRFSI